MDAAILSTLLQVVLCGYIAGGVAGILFWRRDKLAGFFSFGLATLAAGCGILISIYFLMRSAVMPAPSIRLLPQLLPYLEFSVQLNPLSAFFLLLISLLALAISIFSLGYVKVFYGRKSVGILGAFYNALLLATTDRKSVV